jgi:hypothetical protein
MVSRQKAKHILALAVGITELSKIQRNHHQWEKGHPEDGPFLPDY